MSGEDVTTIPYPFIRRLVQKAWEYGDDIYDWKPGVALETDDEVRSEGFAHATGHMVITKIATVALPSPFKSRVFYRREWIDPDGMRFGRKDLRCISASGFATLIKGYRYRYEIDAESRPDHSATKVAA